MHFFVWSIRNAQHNYSVETCQEFFPMKNGDIKK